MVRSKQWILFSLTAMVLPHAQAAADGSVAGTDFAFPALTALVSVLVLALRRRPR